MRQPHLDLIPGRTRTLHIEKSIPPTDGAGAAATPRLTASLNHHWSFHRCETDAHDNGLEFPDGPQSETVNLPHSARLEPLNASGGRNFQGICWYRRNLVLPPNWKDRIVYLHFQGAMQVTDVLLNGKKLATHFGGYLPFTLDISESANFGAEANALVLRLDNRDNPQVPPGKPQHELDFTYFGGLYRNVKLRVMDRLHISDPILAERPGGGGVFVTYPQVSPQSASVRVQTHILNEHPRPRDCSVVQELISPDGAVAATAISKRTIRANSDADFDQLLQVPDPRLWHPDHPWLYTLRTCVCDETAMVDEQRIRIGIRRIRFDARDGLFINDEKFVSIGANRHQDHPFVGYALADSAHWRDVKKLREGGFTSVRSHYPQAPAFMDACDELGMLAIVSNPGWQFVGDELFRNRAVQNARWMVRRDRNRPSVILWEAALNESNNRELGAALQQAVHEEYPGDQCFTAGDHEPGFSWNGAGGWDLDYLNNDGSKPYWIREWGDHVDNWRDQQSRSRVARGWGETPMLSQVRSHVARLDEIMSGGDAGRLCGACLWAAVDCQRGYHHQVFHGGVLDLFRLPKFGYYFFQSQRSPRTHIQGLNDGPMVFIASHGTFFSPSTLSIFSNCEEVRLLLDGREIGRQKPDVGHAMPHPPFTFQVAPFATEQSTMYMNSVAKIEPAHWELTAQGLIGGAVAATHVVRPPGVAAKLALEPDLCGRPLMADGSDWIRVFARITDARGATVPFADDLVRFEISGEGRIIGDEQIGANPCRAEAGIATILVQSSGQAGKITVTATAFGLEPAELKIDSIAPPEPVDAPIEEILLQGT
jgi:beta-galactosidase